MTKQEKIHNMASCMLSILDALKLFDKDSLELEDETLSEIMFRKMKAYDIDLNKELGLTHVKPVPFTKSKSIKIGNLRAVPVCPHTTVFYCKKSGGSRCRKCGKVV